MLHPIRRCCGGATIGLAILIFAVTAGCGGAARKAAIEKAEAQVRRIADRLDSQTTETGVYIRAKEGDIKETDPWNTPIKVTYAQGGVAETVDVRSAGPDGEFHTDDDLAAQGMATNLKGVGEGIKRHAEETAANAAKGLVKGTVDGVKDSIKDALPFGKKKDQDSEASAEAPRGDGQPDEKSDGEQG